MSGYERQNHVIAEFRLPAILEHQEWKYSGIHFLVTDTADDFLVRHVLGIHRH